MPANIGWQVADGPFVRWAYRDTSLRSYFLNQFSYERARRGPVFFFNMVDRHLVEMWMVGSGYAELAVNLMLDDHPESARDAIRLSVEKGTAGTLEQVLMAWLEIGAGQAGPARERLARLGMGLERGGANEFEPTHRFLQGGGDTTVAIESVTTALVRHPLDADLHGLLADLFLAREGMLTAAQIEAFAARVLAPEAPAGWRRWGAGPDLQPALPAGRDLAGPLFRAAGRRGRGRPRGAGMAPRVATAAAGWRPGPGRAARGPRFAGGCAVRGPLTAGAGGRLGPECGLSSRRSGSPAPWLIRPESP